MSARERGDEMADAVCADSQSGLRARVADAGEVEDQERDDERSEAVDECAAEEDPGWLWECYYVVANGWQGNDYHAETRSNALGEFETDAFQELAEDRAEDGA